MNKNNSIKRAEEKVLVNRKIPSKIFFHCQPGLPFIKFYDPTKIFPEMYFSQMKPLYFLAKETKISTRVFSKTLSYKLFEIDRTKDNYMNWKTS